MSAHSTTVPATVVYDTANGPYIAVVGPLAGAIR